MTDTTHNQPNETSAMPIKPRVLTAAEVEFAVEIEQDHIPYEGNCSAVDDDTDRETEQWIRDQLNNGNECAWCYVRVVARWNGIEGQDSLGACSYESRLALKRDLLPEMRANALNDLNRNLAQLANTIARDL